MPRDRFDSPMPFPPGAVFQYHARPGALPRLVPLWAEVRIELEPESLKDGSRAVLQMKTGPIWRRWVAEHFGYEAGKQFCDRQLKGPFAKWTHVHRVEPAPTESSSVLSDQIEYRLPFALRLGHSTVKKELGRAFAFRHARTRFDLTRQAPHATKPPLRIAITGSTGAIGSALTPFLRNAGHTVLSLTRDAPKRPNEVQWNIKTGEVDRTTLGKVDVVVHLAGKNIATRWTDAAKREIRESRVDATQKLCEELAHLPNRPRVLVCASAIGYYGNRGEEVLTEESAPGTGWLEQTCVEWETATQPARDAGIRVVNLRTAVVLSAKHGALAKMLTPAKLGMTGRVGSGQQWMPWISMDDQLGVIYESIQRDDWHGPINSVTASVRQIDFIRTLGKVLGRPTFAPLPKSAVSLLFGEMGRELLLGSTNVAPARLRARGFEWMLPDLEAALRFELGRTIA